MTMIVWLDEHDERSEHIFNIKSYRKADKNKFITIWDGELDVKILRHWMIVMTGVVDVNLCAE